MSTDIVLECLDAPAAARWLDGLVTLYLDVYAGGSGPFHGEQRYRRQLEGHLAAPGWQAVTASCPDASGARATLVGYAYGFPLGPGSRWWAGLLTEMAADFGVENGQRTFAISEIMVAAGFRRRGIGRVVHDTLLSTRREQRATLLVEPGNEAGQAAYASWGWHWVARLRPSWPDAPLFDVLMLSLHDRS